MSAKMLAKPNPLALSNHFTRAGSSGSCAISSGVAEHRSAMAGIGSLAGGVISSTSTACMPRGVF